MHYYYLIFATIISYYRKGLFYLQLVSGAIFFFGVRVSLMSVKKVLTFENESFYMVVRKEMQLHFFLFITMNSLSCIKLRFDKLTKGFNENESRRFFCCEMPPETVVFTSHNYHYYFLCTWLHVFTSVPRKQLYVCLFFNPTFAQ